MCSLLHAVQDLPFDHTSPLFVAVSLILSFITSGCCLIRSAGPGNNHRRSKVWRYSHRWFVMIFGNTTQKVFPVLSSHTTVQCTSCWSLFLPFLLFLIPVVTILITGWTSFFPLMHWDRKRVIQDWKSTGYKDRRRKHLWVSATETHRLLCIRLSLYSCVWCDADGWCIRITTPSFWFLLLNVLGKVFNTSLTLLLYHWSGQAGKGRAFASMRWSWGEEEEEGRTEAGTQHHDLHAPRHPLPVGFSSLFSFLRPIPLVRMNPEPKHQQIPKLPHAHLSFPSSSSLYPIVVKEMMRREISPSHSLTQGCWSCGEAISPGSGRFCKASTVCAFFPEVDSKPPVKKRREEEYKVCVLQVNLLKRAHPMSLCLFCGQGMIQTHEQTILTFYCLLMHTITRPLHPLARIIWSSKSMREYYDLFEQTVRSFTVTNQCLSASFVWLMYPLLHFSSF